MKISYIAHPIGGDVINNLRKIAIIARQINLVEPEVVPFAPYYLDCVALKDSSPKERKRGIKNDIALFEKRIIDELRLYGDRISDGMLHEIRLCWKLNIPIVPMTSETSYDFQFCKIL